MILLEDTRNQIDKHGKKHAWFEKNGIEIQRTKLVVGDYTLPTNQSICIDTKKDLQELCGNVTSQHKRFVAELDLAAKLGIKLIVLCEHSPQIKCLEDVQQWTNPRLKFSPKALTGEKLFKILHSIEVRHGCKFEFCGKSETAKRIVDILMGGDLYARP